MQKPSLIIVEAELSLDEIASALRVSSSDALRKFRDSRVTSWFAEIWGEKLFSYRTHANSNHPGSDGAISLGNIGRFDISVRCFYCGNIKFQKSKFIGSGRSATKDDLISSIESVERVVLVDLRAFPKLRFIPLDSKPLLRLAYGGKLSPGGMTPRRLDAWLEENFAVSVSQIALTA